MNIFAIASGIVSIAKAIPYLYKMLNIISEKLIEEKISNISTNRLSHREKRNILLNRISKAQTNEERKHLSIILADYGMSDDPDSEGDS